MATQTEHYQLSLREGTDIFNPLSTNDNFTKIDELIYNAGAGGMISATPAVSGNTMSFTNVTMVAGETVVKFVLASEQQVNKFSFGGSTINVVDLSGAQVTVGKGLWIGYVDTNSTFKVLAWPMSVDADTLDGKEPDYYATATAVAAAASAANAANEAAQAATTVANQALAAASGAGMELLWTNPTPNQTFAAQAIEISKDLSNYKVLVIALKYSTTETMQGLGMLPVGVTNMGCAAHCVRPSGGWYRMGRAFTIPTSGKTVTNTQGGHTYDIADESSGSGAGVAIPVNIWGLG